MPFPGLFVNYKCQVWRRRSLWRYHPQARRTCCGVTGSLSLQCVTSVSSRLDRMGRRQVKWNLSGGRVGGRGCMGCMSRVVVAVHPADVTWSGSSRLWIVKVIIEGVAIVKVGRSPHRWRHATRRRLPFKPPRAALHLGRQPSRSPTPWPPPPPLTSLHSLSSWTCEAPCRALQSSACQQLPCGMWGICPGEGVEGGGGEDR